MSNIHLQGPKYMADISGSIKMSIVQTTMISDRLSLIDSIHGFVTGGCNLAWWLISYLIINQLLDNRPGHSWRQSTCLLKELTEQRMLLHRHLHLTKWNLEHYSFLVPFFCTTYQAVLFQLLDTVLHNLHVKLEP